MMSNDARIIELVEEALNSELSAEQVCAQQPELVSEVRVYLDECRGVDEMFKRRSPPRRAHPLQPSGRHRAYG
jgi:hypothetical protein